MVSDIGCEYDGSILDVGCGYNAIGDVNCDLFIDREYRQSIKPKRIPNFIFCDCQYLPFADNCFKFVYCSHVIEHVKKPFQLLKELIRVSNRFIKLRLPHRFNLYRIGDWHIQFFNETWFVKVLSKMNVGFSIRTIHKGMMSIPFIMPCEIEVLIRKRIYS